MRGEGDVVRASGTDGDGALNARFTKIIAETAARNLTAQDLVLTSLREAILSCKSGGTVSVIGVYTGLIDKFPMNAVMNRSLTIKCGQAHVQRYMKPLLDRIMNGEIDPSFVITHTMGLDEAPQGFQTFRDKQDNCIKIVLKPDMH